VVVRADADTGLGGGHLMRCLALAEAWRGRGGPVRLLTHDPAGTPVRRLAAAGLDVVCVPRHPDPADLRETLAHAAALAGPAGRRAWLVADGPHLDAAYRGGARAAGLSVLMIDDTAREPARGADVLLNPNLDAERLDHGADPGTLLVLGPRYALVREEFRRARELPRDTAPVARRLLVTLGGSDPANVSARVLEALDRLDVPGLSAVLIAGAHSAHGPALQAAAAACGTPVRIVTDAPDMAHWMAWADLAVAGGGGTCWELATLGIPALLLVAAADQQPNVRGLDARQAAVAGGDLARISAADLAARLRALCLDAGHRRRLADSARGLVDGRGAERVVGLVAALDGGPIGPGDLGVRDAAPGDALAVWRLANDPGVRRQSFSPAPIPLDGHLEWFARQLASPDVRFWIVELAEVFAGQVRYTRVAPDTLEVHFAVVPALRGRGLGTMALALTWERACHALGATRVRGLVLPDNQPSARAFARAGFRQVGGGEARGQACLTFERACA
jgi:UDP-2,4-diacetamido-2,4,6-trideoxy-beta-L-altropyranose hydrolase